MSSAVSPSLTILAGSCTSRTTHFSFSGVIRSPAIHGPREIELNVTDSMWQYYYRPTLELIAANPQILERMLPEPVLMDVDHLDMKIGIWPSVLKLVVEHHMEAVKQGCLQHHDQIEAGYQPDGIRVVAGESWLEPFREYETRK